MRYPGSAVSAITRAAEMCAHFTGMPSAGSLEPSQGTHFFQNLTSFGVGYFTINDKNGDICDIEYLDSMPAVYESDHLRSVRFSRPLQIGINGKTGLGIIVKPTTEDN